jgi:uncharacterized protein
MTQTLPADVAELAGRVEAHLGSPARLGVAFSGGVDSSVLLALATRSLGPDRTLAILGVSPSLAASERRAAHEVAAGIGAPLVELPTHELERAEYRANGPDRCFHCKTELFSRIDDEVAARYRLSAIAYGENADDMVRPDRPGARAATNHRVLRPLADAGLRKADVRLVARALGLPSADKPAAPCLASRIPHHEPVTAEKLRQIEDAEEVLHELGFTDARVRHHGEIARIELPAAELLRAVTEPTRAMIAHGVRAAGFRFVSLDLAGIQSGAFTLPLVTRSPEPEAEPSPEPAGEPVETSRDRPGE